MTVVWAEQRCQHLSAPGYREGVENLGEGMWRLKDGCVVRAFVEPKNPWKQCPTCKGSCRDPTGPDCECCSNSCPDCEDGDQLVVCPDCKGQDDECRPCDGNGRVKVPFRNGAGGKE